MRKLVIGCCITVIMVGLLVTSHPALEQPQQLAPLALSLYTSPSPRDYAASRMPSSA
jgi:hypothetical protein